MKRATEDREFSWPLSFVLPVFRRLEWEVRKNLPVFHRVARFANPLGPPPSFPMAAERPTGQRRTHMPHDTSSTEIPSPRTIICDASLSHVNADDMIDQMACIRDLSNVYDFIYSAIDPIEGLPSGPNDVERAQLASLLRIVNREFNSRLNTVERMLEPAQ